MHKRESLNKNQPPLKGEGNRRQTVEGFFVESFAWCKRVYGSTPQSSLRLASSPKGEPKKASPLGEGNRRQTVEGFFVESFA